MQNISSSEELRYAIEILEADQVIKGQVFKDQIILTYESLKPINIIEKTLKDITSSEFLIHNVPGTIMGLVSGYLSKKIFTSGSVNIFRKLLGSVLQLGVTAVVAKNSEVIKTTGLSIIEHFLRKK